MNYCIIKIYVFELTTYCFFTAVGASDYPCSDTYAGNKPFSEPETAAFRDFVLANKKSIKLYLTLHSYGQASVLFHTGDDSFSI